CTRTTGCCNFFFQAEDGIRGRNVTGVQTCALPIFGGIWGGIATGLFAQSSINPVAQWDGLLFGDVHLFLAQLVGIVVSIAIAIRSEERRVGKECKNLGATR